MTSNTTITNINALFEKVIGMACESDMVDKLKSMWTSDEVQDELAILMKRSTEKSQTNNTKLKLKDKDAPVKPKNAYMFFSIANFTSVKSDLGENTPISEVARELGNRWKALKESDDVEDLEQLDHFNDLAAKDKLRYEKDIKEYERPSDEILSQRPYNQPRKKSGVKDKNAPKKPLNSYMLFTLDKRDKIAELLADELGYKPSIGEIGRACGKEWKSLRESKDPDDIEFVEQYTNKAESAKKEYEAALAKYNHSKESDPEISSDENQKPSPKKQKKSQPNKKKSKGNKSPYSLYCEAHIDDVRNELGDDATPAAIRKQLSKSWKGLDKDSKDDWNAKAKV